MLPMRCIRFVDVCTHTLATLMVVHIHPGQALPRPYIIPLSLALVNYNYRVLNKVINKSMLKVRIDLFVRRIKGTYSEETNQ